MSHTGRVVVVLTSPAMACDATAFALASALRFAVRTLVFAARMDLAFAAVTTGTSAVEAFLSLELLASICGLLLGSSVGSRLECSNLVR